MVIGHAAFGRIAVEPAFDNAWRAAMAQLAGCE
jgi:hypothetical protein